MHGTTPIACNFIVRRQVYQLEIKLRTLEVHLVSVWPVSEWVIEYCYTVYVAFWTYLSWQYRDRRKSGVCSTHMEWIQGFLYTVHNTTRSIGLLIVWSTVCINLEDKYPTLPGFEPIRATTWPNSHRARPVFKEQVNASGYGLSVGLMLAQRRRRCTNITPSIGQHIIVTC